MGNLSAILVWGSVHKSDFPAAPPLVLLFKNKYHYLTSNCTKWRDCPLGSMSTFALKCHPTSREVEEWTFWKAKEHKSNSGINPHLRQNQVCIWGAQNQHSSLRGKVDPHRRVIVCVSHFVIPSRWCLCLFLPEVLWIELHADEQSIVFSINTDQSNYFSFRAVNFMTKLY